MIIHVPPRLISFSGCPNHTAEKDVVTLELKILSSRIKSTHIDFRMRYAGYDMSYDRSQPRKAMCDSPALPSYLWDNRTKAMIAKEHTESVISSHQPKRNRREDNVM